MSFVDFVAKCKYVNLKREPFFWDSELLNIPTQAWKNANPYVAERWSSKAMVEDDVFVKIVVATVKKTHFETSDKTCCISLKSLSFPPEGSCSSPITQHLAVISQILHRSYGIEITQVEQPPTTMKVTWQHDHPCFHPAVPYLIKARKEGTLTDCTLEFNHKLFPVHKIVLAAKSPYFETMFKSPCQESPWGATIPIAMKNLEEKSVEMLLDYFYTGELDLKAASVTHIDNLVNLSDYFDLPHLQQICFEYLCKNVNADNVKEYVELARHYQHEELVAAIIEHITPEVTLENFEKLVNLGKLEKMQDLIKACTVRLSQLIEEIGYEIWGLRNTIHITSFVKFFEVIITTESWTLLPPLLAQIQIVLSQPGYRTHLEKLIEYLALICEYQSRFPVSQSIDLVGTKDQLQQDVITSIQSRGTKQYQEHFSFELVEKCLKVAEKYQLKSIKIGWTSVLIGKIRLKSTDPGLLNLIEPYLQIAHNYGLSDLGGKSGMCATALLMNLNHTDHGPDHVAKMLALANKFNLDGVKASCETRLSEKKST